MSQDNSSNKPTHVVFHIKEGNQVNDDGYKKGFWTRIGAGWQLPSGRINMVLDYEPRCAGTLQLVSVEQLEQDKSKSAA